MPAVGSIHGVLLAAGAGTRFGGGKLLHLLADGSPIGVASWRNLVGALPHSIAILRPDDDALADALVAVEAHVEIAPEAHLGMGHSLARAIGVTPGASGWVIALADMPRLRIETIQAVARALEQGASIVVPTYRGERGHPVGFSCAHRDELLSLTGDQGARSILQRNAAQITRLEVADPGILQDIDTREDAQRLSR